MVEATLQNEPAIRLAVFVTVFATMAIWELLAPRRQLTVNRGGRWLTNLALVIVDAIAVRLLVPVLAVSWAQTLTEKSWGLFNWLELPFWFEFILAIALLDMLIYWQHVASHKINVLWRFHKVHHVDRDIDVTTGARFHPVEIVLSMFYKLLCISILGPMAFAVLVFEVLLNASAMFNHSNVNLSPTLDRILRTLVVTPDMHRVHHSVLRNETDSNFGFFLSVWDKCFGSYITQPTNGHEGMTIGLALQQNTNPNRLFWALAFPFKKEKKVSEQCE